MNGRGPRQISVSKSSLPAGYTEVAYIQSDGAAYINTGVKPNLNTEVRADIAHDLSGETEWIFGARNGANVGAFGFLTYKGAYRADYSAATTTLDEKPTGRFEIGMDRNSIKINGKVVAVSAESNFATQYPLYMFANNNAGSAAGFSVTKIYRAEIYDSNNLVRKLIPCRRNSDNVLGMYDIAKGTFYTNAGSGAFNAG